MCVGVVMVLALLLRVMKGNYLHRTVNLGSAWAKTAEHIGGDFVDGDGGSGSDSDTSSDCYGGGDCDTNFRFDDLVSSDEDEWSL